MGISPGMVSFSGQLAAGLELWAAETSADIAAMKTTTYFQFRRKQGDRAAIKDEWIREVIAHPIKTEKQIDGRIRKWGPIAEAGGRYLRVVLLEDGQTIHNVFFDRDFMET